MFQQIVATTIMCLAFLLNTYKISLTLVQPYSIFPWVNNIVDPTSSDQIVSKSEPLWLFFHTIISLSLVFVAWYYVMKFKKNSILNKLFALLHVVFILMILYNKDNLGKLNVQRADIINLGCIVLLTVAYIYNCYFGYLAVLAMPVYLEFFAILKYIMS